jgi:hypothetical protein
LLLVIRPQIAETMMMKLVWKLAWMIGAAGWLTMSTAALAQTGGYPASPSHAVVGNPAPDNSPRYGKEPGNNANPSEGSNSRGAERPKAGETTGNDSKQTGSGSEQGATRGDVNR